MGPGDALTITDAAEHHIDTTDTTPIRAKPRWLGPIRTPDVEKEVQQMVEKGVI